MGKKARNKREQAEKKRQEREVLKHILGVYETDPPERPDDPRDDSVGFLFRFSLIAFVSHSVC